MLLALFCSFALAQHAHPLEDTDQDTEVEERLEDLEELVEARDQELDDLRTAAARLLELVAEDRGLDPAGLAPELETDDNADVNAGEELVEDLEELATPEDVDTAED